MGSDNIFTLKRNFRTQIFVQEDAYANLLKRWLVCTLSVGLYNDDLGPIGPYAYRFLVDTLLYEMDDGFLFLVYSISWLVN